ncbi:unknown [Bacteroides sp. CAG:709]|nr:unknown [Bacteroides sp. CAG:709]
MEAEEAAVDSQEVAAERDAVPDAGLQEVQAGVGIYRGSAFLEDGHYAAEDVASGTMFAADGAITLHNSLVTIQLDNAVKNVSACDTEKYDVSYGQRASIGQGLKFHGIPVPTYEGEHAHALDGDGYILAFAEDTEDFRKKYVIADNYFLHNCIPVYLPD